MPSANCLALLHITRWVPRPIVPACWVLVGDVIVLLETRNWQSHLLPAEKHLFRAIFKAFSWPEELSEKTQPFDLNLGAAQFNSAPIVLWVWGEVLGRHLLDLKPSHTFPRATLHQAEGYACPLIVSPGLGSLLKNPPDKRKLWEDGLFVKAHTTLQGK